MTGAKGMLLAVFIYLIHGTNSTKLFGFMMNPQNTSYLLGIFPALFQFWDSAEIKLNREKIKHGSLLNYLIM